MRGTLILAHGSRVDETTKTIEQVVGWARELLPEEPMEIAYMEFHPTNIREGVRRLAECGVTEIKAVPYFLFEGIHIQEDIPNEFQEIMKDFPKVSLSMGKTLGADKRLASILVDRIQEA